MGTAGAGEPSLAGCQWATSSPLLELPGVSGSQLGLSLPAKEMRKAQSLRDGGSDRVGVKGRKHMSLPRKAGRAAEGYRGLFYAIRTYTKFKRKVLDKRNQLSVSITCIEGPMSSKGVFSKKK